MYKNIFVKPYIPKQQPTKIFYGLVKTEEYGDIFLAYYLENDLYYICFLHFFKNQTIEELTNKLQKYWPQSQCINDNVLTKEIYAKYLSKQNKNQEVYVALNGTDFQNKVWLALLEIPYGQERTYADVAVIIGNPKAVRAVGNAVGSNNIAILIPCHRVKAKTGDLLKYRWGSELKRKILFNENANI